MEKENSQNSLQTGIHQNYEYTHYKSSVPTSRRTKAVFNLKSNQLMSIMEVIGIVGIIRNT
jgi:hypothetical protein